MSDAKHTPPGDASFRRSLVRNSAGAAGLVVVVAAAFWAIGTFGGESGTPVASDDDVAPDVTAPDDGAGPDQPDDGDTAPDGTATGDDGADADDAAADDAAADDGAADDRVPDDGADADDAAADDGAADDGAADDGEDGDGNGEGDSTEVDRALDPAEVTIQVLDGVKDDGGAAADGVADLLDGAGYDIIARNDALSYDVTTVLYNPGNEAAAQQVAAELGGAEVREQPGNLSSAVALHVVVGRDRA